MLGPERKTSVITILDELEQIQRTNDMMSLLKCKV